jgi:hypothetical protein
VNRVCYKTALFSRSAEDNAAGTLGRWAKKRKQRGLVNAVIVCLAMSHERISDRVRLVNLLQTFKYVVGVSNIRVPVDPSDYEELEPYVLSGRYTQFSMDFKNFRESSARQRNELFDYLEEKQDVPERIVCLDYFFLQHPYYRERYGMNWLLRDRPTGRGRKEEGKARQLLDYATDVYLGVDDPSPNGSLMQEMIQEYVDYTGPKTMRYDAVLSSPLYELDKEIDIPGPSHGAENQVTRYLDEERPFLHITLEDDA